MCGIAGIFNIKQQTPELRKGFEMSQKIRHRGPDWSGIYVGGPPSSPMNASPSSILQCGGQPLYSARPQTDACRQRRDLQPSRNPCTVCRKIRLPDRKRLRSHPRPLPDKGIRFLEELNGIFAFALYDEERTIT